MVRSVVVVAGVMVVGAAVGLAAWRLFADRGRVDEAPVEAAESPVLEESASVPGVPAVILLGEELHVKHGCSVCHKSDGSKGLGPSYAEQWGSTVALAGGGSVTYDEFYVREAILDANAKRNAAYPAIMSSYSGKLTQREVEALTLWIRSQTEAARDEAYRQARAAQ